MNRLLVAIGLALLVGCSSSRAMRANVRLPSELGPSSHVSVKVIGELAPSSSRTDEAVPRVAVVPRPAIDTDADTHELVVLAARMMTFQRPTLVPVDDMRSMLTPPDPVYSHSDYMTMLDYHHPEYGRKFDLGYFLIAAGRQLWENLR